MMKKISIVLLNWKGTDDTIECLNSVLSQTRLAAFRTIIIDNDSGDDSLSRLCDHCRYIGADFEVVAYDSSTDTFSSAEGGKNMQGAGISLIQANENLGFCSGNNVGARYAFNCGADSALILNNDTTVAPDFVEKLGEAACELGARTLLSPQILYQDEPDVIWWFGGDFSPLLSVTYRSQGARRKTGISGYPETNWVSGCATLISRELFSEIGLYDPCFFIWCEEWDLSLRASRRGISLQVVPDAIVYHKVGKSLGLVSPLTFFYSMRNMIFLRRRYVPFILRWGFMLIYIPRKFFQALIFSAKYHDLIYIQAFFDALIDFRGGIWKRQ